MHENKTSRSDTATQLSTLIKLRWLLKDSLWSEWSLSTRVMEKIRVFTRCTDPQAVKRPVLLERQGKRHKERFRTKAVITIFYVSASSWIYGAGNDLVKWLCKQITSKSDSHALGLQVQQFSPPNGSNLSRILLNYQQITEKHFCRLHTAHLEKTKPNRLEAF